MKNIGKQVKAIDELRQFPQLKCGICEKNLLEDIGMSLFAIVKDSTGNVIDAYFACKGEHDQAYQIKYQEEGYITNWYEFSDFTNPMTWISNVRDIMYLLKEENISSEAFKKILKLVVGTFPYVCRDMSESEVCRYKDWAEFGLV